MSEQPKNPHSEAPKASDELESESEENLARKGAASTSNVRDQDDDDDDEEDEDEDEDESEDGDDSDDDDDEEEEEDDHKGAHSKSTRPEQSPDADDAIPDWGPWAVLGVLVLIGLVGGLGGLNGLIHIEKPRAEEPAEPTPASTPSATAAAARPLAKPLASARAKAAMDPADSETVEASHLLVAYKGSRRAAPTVTRTKEEAKKRADEALAKAKKKGAEFEKVVAEYSDEPRAAERGGKLGAFTRRRMAKEFSDAAFALKPGELSGVVETPFGYHVILRTK